MPTKNVFDHGSVLKNGKQTIFAKWLPHLLAAQGVFGMAAMILMPFATGNVDHDAGTLLITSVWHLFSSFLSLVILVNAAVWCMWQIEITQRLVVIVGADVLKFSTNSWVWWFVPLLSWFIPYLALRELHTQTYLESGDQAEKMGIVLPIVQFCFVVGALLRPILQPMVDAGNAPIMFSTTAALVLVVFGMISAFGFREFVLRMERNMKRAEERYGVV